MTIRKYQKRDAQAAARICLGTFSGEWMNQEAFREALIEVYCRYYIEREPGNCFVAVDEADIPKGYLLCAEKFWRVEAGIF